MTAPSPFLPGTHIQFAWDSTSLGDLKTCGRLYQYRMIEGWVPKDENIHLRFGLEYHKAFEDYEHAIANGMSHDDAVREALRQLLIRTKDWDPDILTKAGQYKNRWSLVRTVLWYFDYYKDDKAVTYRLADDTPAVELSFKFELDWGPAQVHLNKDGTVAEDITPQPYLLCGHLDRVVVFNDATFVLDHKTTTQTLGSYYFNQFEPDNQMTLYSMAGKIVLDAPINGVIIDAAQLLADDTRFVRSFTFRTQEHINEWLADLRYWLTLAEQFAKAEHWPMNDKACSMYGGCRFREVCSKSPSVRRRFLESNFVQLPPEERWNPLKAR